MERARTDPDSSSLLILHEHAVGRNQKCGGANITHVAMDGIESGKFCLPDDKHAEFLAAVGKDLINKRKLYFCELATPISALFFDLDFQAQSAEELPNTADFVAQIVPHIRNRVANFFPVLDPMHPDYERQLTVIVVGGEPGLKNFTKQKKYGVGMHVHFPHIQITMEHMTVIRNDIVSFLHIEIPQFQWASILDEKVYFQSRGLRMVGMRKADKCSVCVQKVVDYKKMKTASGAKMSTGPPCAICANFRHVDLGDNRVYKFMYCSDTVFHNRLSREVDTLVYMCSIRRPTEMYITDGFVIPGSAPLPATFGISGPLTKQRYEDARNKAMSRKPTGIKSFFQRNEKLDCTVEPDAFMVATQLVQSFLKPWYSRLFATEIARNSQTGEMYILVEGENNRYCLNKMPDGMRGVRGGHHTSAKIYFRILDFKWFHQCCTSFTDPQASEKRDTRYNGDSCHKWQSEPVQVHVSAIPILFPEGNPTSTPSSLHSSANGSSNSITLSLMPSSSNVDEDPLVSHFKKLQELSWQRASRPNDMNMTKRPNYSGRRTSTSLQSIFSNSMVARRPPPAMEV